MLDLAEVQPAEGRRTAHTGILNPACVPLHHYVLEPWAGTGDLASAIAFDGVSNIDCFELHPLLKQALILQGFNLVGGDFLANLSSG